MISLLLALIYLAYISLGLPDSLLGAAWPEMYQIFGVNVSSMGIVTIIISGSTIVACSVGDKLTFKLGPGLVAALSTLLVAISMFLFATAKSFIAICFIAIPYGLGAGAIDTAMNNYVALHYSARSMNFLHAFWGIGAIISPFIMSYALAYKTYRSGYFIVGIIQFVLGLLFLCALPLWAACKRKNISENKEVEQINLKLKDKFKIKGLIFFLFAFFSENAMEGTLIAWIPSYLVEYREFSSDFAASISSLYFIGMTASRVLCGLFGKKLGDKRIIRIGIPIILIGSLLLAIPFKNEISIYISITIIGLGIGPLFPAFIHSSPHTFGKSYSLAVVGLVMTFAYIGSTFMPPVYGLLSEFVSPSVLPYFTIFWLCLTLTLFEITHKQRKNINV